MLIGVPKEIKNHEYRVGLTPSSVFELCHRGHQVLVETQAGAGIQASDDTYQQAGARIVPSADAVYDDAEMIVKVKEPQPAECRKLSSGQTLFTYLHLAPDIEQTTALLKSGATCIAYETVTDAHGTLPLLAPMSEVAGRLSIQAGATFLQKANGGKGTLLGGVPGVLPANVCILGGGVVGINAAKMAVGLGAQVTILDRSLPRLRSLNDLFDGRVHTLFSTTAVVQEQLKKSDLVVGAVLLPGASAPKLVTKNDLALLQAGSVLVDVAIDQGGCFESSRPTTHQQPTYTEQGVVHYCVANMPGAVPKTSAQALNNATLPFTLALADKGVMQAMADDIHLRQGLNIHAGKLIHPAVIAAQPQQAEHYQALDSLFID